MASVTITKGEPGAPDQTVSVEIPQQHIPSKAGEGLPPISSIALIASLSAVVSWGFVQSVKQGVRNFRKAKKKKGDPWWLSSVLRILSVGLGAFAGWLLFDPMGVDGLRYWGLAIGGSGGALATIIVQQIKSKIRGRNA